MKDLSRIRPRKSEPKGRPDYYITPTHDFKQYTRDSAENFWNQDSAFDWGQDVKENLRKNLEGLRPAGFSKVVSMVLPMVAESVDQKIHLVRQGGLPANVDALKDIEECLPGDKPAIQEALRIQAPLQGFKAEVAALEDRVEILREELTDLKERQRLGYVKEGVLARPAASETERNAQEEELKELEARVRAAEEKCRVARESGRVKAGELKAKVKAEFKRIEGEVLRDLEETRALLARGMEGETGEMPALKSLILKRQLRGLKDIANHALVVEQSAIAPLTMGIIHYKRHREIQEALTTFINDEAKHSATFRRFLVEKLDAREFVSSNLIRGANRYMWLARFLPGMGLFLAVIVEAIGAAYLEFFGEEEYMPDKLFRKICHTISVQDERRHMDLCVGMYNELFRKGRRWERYRNGMALKVMMKSVYGDKTDDHHLIQAFRAFGVGSDVLYKHIFDRLSQQLARVSMYVTPETLMGYIGRN